MTKTEYRALRKQLDFEPSVTGATLSVLIVLGTFGAGFVLLRTGHTLTYVLSQLLFALGAFQAFAVVHDCGHGSFARSKWVNTLVGHLASLLCLTPYFSWKYIHHQHHVWSGNTEKDPAVRVLHKWRTEGRVPPFPRFAWRTWVPVVAAMQQVVFATYPLAMLRKGRLDFSKAWRAALSVLFLVFALAALSWIGDVDLVANFGLAALFYLYLTEVINVPHHMDRPGHDGKLPVWEQGDTTRSCDYPPVLARLVAFNFNLHVEHHIFPTLPWYRLHKATEAVKATGRYEGSMGVKWVMKNRRRPLESVALVRAEKLG